jgi:DNA-binding NarL/FixJ family response regulator
MLHRSSLHPNATNRKPGKKSILLIEDHPVTRAGLVCLINNEADLAVCAESDGTDAIQLATKRRPDAAIVDLALGPLSGVELVKQLRAVRPEMPVLVLSMYAEEIHADRAIQSGQMAT